MARIINPIPSITNKGIKVKSKSEKKVADILTKYHISYIYEKSTPVGEYTFMPDFYLPMYDIYIEFFGLLVIKKYMEKTKWKRKMYKKYGIKLISLYPRHIYKKSDIEIIIYITRAIKSMNGIKTK